MRDFHISPKYRLSDWQNLTFRKEMDWKKAIRIIHDRIQGRFIRWVDRIVKKQFSGFAVVALDCLLIETLDGFQRGAARNSVEDTYRNFLTRNRFGFDTATSVSFYKNVRCGIVHETETRRGWLIEQSIPQGKIWTKKPDRTLILNRSKFHAAVKAEEKDWIDKLKAGDKTLRANMRCRMSEIISRSI